MAFDLDGFLKELGATGDEETTLRTALGKPERLTLLEKNQLRQGDYSKNMNALGKSQTDLQAAQQRLDAELAEWATLTASEKESAVKLRSDLEAAQQKVLTLTQRVQRVATDAGLDPVKALEGIDQTPPKKPEPTVPAFDESKFVDRATFGQLNDYMFGLVTELPMLAQEHFEATGERLDTRALHAEIMARAKVKGADLNPRTIWEEKYQIKTKLAEKDKAARAAELQQAEQRGFERARTEAALPIPPSVGVHSPVLKTLDGKPRESVLKRPQPEAGLRSVAMKLDEMARRPAPAGAGA
jgi:hypothetical protein